MIKHFAPGNGNLHDTWVGSGRLPAKATACFDNAHGTSHSEIEIEITYQSCRTINCQISYFVFNVFLCVLFCFHR